LSDLVAFYATTSGLSFTLLGLWWVVADRRRPSFLDRDHRRMAYVVSLHFMLPGAMSVLSLLDSGTYVWRVVFALAGAAGAVGALLMSSGQLEGILLALVLLLGVNAAWFRSTAPDPLPAGLGLTPAPQ
jgi:hypothetical protein